MLQEQILLSNVNLTKLDRICRNYPNYVRYDIVEKNENGYTDILLYYKSASSLLIASLITLR